ncbi:MAG: SH3 domain-containing protein [Chloroflexota bacterium]|nr:SH3 domain-containing protein [Chloroflexota bacterium]
MTDPGLSGRLRQRSRRAGLMVGVSMALSILICVGVFAAIYAGLTPWLSDIVPIAPAASTQVANTGGGNQPANNPTGGNAQPAIAAAPNPAPTPTPAPDVAPEPEPTAEPDTDDFAPTHQIDNPNGESINLRPEPSTSNEAIRALSIGTPLQFLDEESPSADGLWMLFATAEGEEGWVREIDTATFAP